MAIRRNPETGKIIAKRFKLAKLERVVMGDNSTGFCIACGAEQGGCEPDARKYTCETCELNCVYGAEELILMGRVA